MKLKGVTNDIYFDSTGCNGNVLFHVSALDKNGQNKTLQEKTMATWNPKSGLYFTERDLFPYTYKDFKNIIIKMGCIEVWRNHSVILVIST